MYAHLNPRTRKVIEQLIAGGTSVVAGQVIPALSNDQRRLLHVLSTKFGSLLKGDALVGQLEKELAAAPELKAIEDTAAIPELLSIKSWRFGQLRAYSFRGLAPAGHEWTYDFDGRSHLLYGPNGCGKSSLMGAVAWCLTGKLFRDDCEPRSSEDIEVYTTEDKAKSAGARPCALALTDSNGANTPSDAPFWVALELVPHDSDSTQQPIWIRRHRSEGLSTSTDNVAWRTINTVEDIGISELDTELHVLMPARVPHLRFTPQLRMTCATHLSS